MADRRLGYGEGSRSEMHDEGCRRDGLGGRFPGVVRYYVLGVLDEMLISFRTRRSERADLRALSTERSYMSQWLKRSYPVSITSNWWCLLISTDGFAIEQGISIDGMESRTM